MIYYLEGAFVSALALVVALSLGRMVETHPSWWIFSNEWAATTMAVFLDIMLVVGCVAAWSACVEQGLSQAIWMPVYAAVILAVPVLVRAAFALPRLGGGAAFPR